MSEKLPRLDAAAFTAPAAPVVESREVVLAGLGTVIVRGFTKAQERVMRKEAIVGGEIDAEALEVLMFREGMVDPQLTQDEALAAFDNWGSGQINVILMAISELSGLAPSSIRDEVVSFREDS